MNLFVKVGLSCTSYRRVLYQVQEEVFNHASCPSVLLLAIDPIPKQQASRVTLLEIIFRRLLTSSLGHHRWRPVTLLIPNARSHLKRYCRTSHFLNVLDHYRSSYFSFASRRCSRGNGIPNRRFCKNCWASAAAYEQNTIVDGISTEFHLPYSLFSNSASAWVQWTSVSKKMAQANTAKSLFIMRSLSNTDKS